MKPILLRNTQFRVEIDPIHGGITRISHPRDPHRMNWVCSPPETGWLMRSQSWGLGFIGLSTAGFAGRTHWDRAASLRADATSCTVLYRLPGMDLRIRRELTPNGEFRERYFFTSRLDAEHACGGDTIGSFGIFTPWNDNYPSGTECVLRRCNAHLWPHGAFAWVCALRMGGRHPHLGLVQDRGALAGYSIEGRNRCSSSNTRGAIVTHPDRMVWQPGQRRELGWTLFWHQGWDDFFAKLDARPGFLRIQATRSTWSSGDPVTLQLRGKGATPAAKLRINGQPVEITQDSAGAPEAHWTAAKPGEFTAEAGNARGVAHFTGQVTPAANDLLAARARFIVRNQQIKRPGHPLDGALAVYDNDAGQIIANSDAWPDQNEARERVGMGVFLALWLQRHPGKELQLGLDRYHRFVREHLQDAQGNVLGSAGGDSHRLYNFPWVAQLHLEMHRLTGDPAFLRSSVDTLRAYYARAGERFYAVGIPMRDLIAALDQAGWRKERAQMLALFQKHARRIARFGTDYPAHEVNYEQSIVGPAAIMLLETYLLTRRPSYLEAARAQLRCLEAFNGRQPDYHLNEIAIRHWDGYWFGQRKLWGDTFPHYWSVLTAHAYSLYWQATGADTYRHRAAVILQNNLCAFTPEGRASCAFVYPTTVNGTVAHSFDPYANDQDWALVYYLLATRQGLFS